LNFIIHRPDIQGLFLTHSIHQINAKQIYHRHQSLIYYFRKCFNMKQLKNIILFYYWQPTQSEKTSSAGGKSWRIFINNSIIFLVISHKRRMRNIFIPQKSYIFSNFFIGMPLCASH